MRPYISIVMPAYNEELMIEQSVLAVNEVLQRIGDPSEILVVNDGSTDGTLEKLKNLSMSVKSLRYVSLVQNSGHMAALSAGLKFAKGDWVLTIDADLQDPVEVIEKMLHIAKSESIDVVYGQRVDRSLDSFAKRITANYYYKFIRRVSGIDARHDAADCRLMSRRVVDVLLDLPEKEKVYRLLVPSLGFPSSHIEYQRNVRELGESHYGIKQMFNLAWNSVISFSSAPLRIASYLGTVGLFVFGMSLVYVGISQITGGTSPGWSSLFLTIAFFGSMQLLVVGLLGEYVARIYKELQNRPIFLVDESKSTN